jgi:hypothetical protein
VKFVKFHATVRSAVQRRMIGWLMKWRGFGRKRMQPYLEFTWRDWGTRRKASVKTATVPAENWSLERHSYANSLGASVQTVQGAETLPWKVREGPASDAVIKPIHCTN